MKILKLNFISWTKKLRPVAKSKLYKLQHADAKDVHRILVEVIKQQLEVSQEIQEQQKPPLAIELQRTRKEHK